VIYAGEQMRLTHCKGRALPAELSARGLIVADLTGLVNHCVAIVPRHRAHRRSGLEKGDW
jgi:hypothetical protein